jgi:release factor glutamine methyltransferase
MSDEPWTIGRLLAWTVEYLEKHGAENPRLDAEVLLARARGSKRIDLYAAFGDEASEELRAKFREFVSRRAKGEPVAYIVGHKEFYSLDFEVTRDVLIPRPETEMLVVALLDHAKKQGAGDGGRGAGKPGSSPQKVASSTGEAAPSAKDSANPVLSTQYSVPESVVRGFPDPALGATEGLPSDESRRPSVDEMARSGARPQRHVASAPVPSPRVADVGTGSGILAVCAAKYLPTARVTAIDISPAALAIARRNAERHGLAERIEFVESDLFAAIPAGEPFDVIVSNPPYVSTAEMAELPPDVRDYEPHTALEAGPEGTEVVARLIAQSAERLKPGGALFLEISPMIAAAVEQLVRESPQFNLAPTLRDPAGHARVVQAIRRSDETR